MNESINELLQDEDPQVVVGEIVKLGKNNGGRRQMQREILQFLIDTIGKSYQLPLQSVDNITADVIQAICDSDKLDMHPCLGPTIKELITRLISETFTNQLLDENIIQDWIKLLQGIVLTKAIAPENSVFKGKALLLMAFMLNPIAELIPKIQQQEDSDINKGIIAALEIIMQEIPKGFSIKSLSVMITHEFLIAIEKHFDLFVIKNNHLKSCMMILALDNQTLLTMLCRTLEKMCEVEDIHKQLIELFTSRVNDDDDDDVENNNDNNMMELFEDLTMKNHSKVVVISLMKAIAQIPGSNSLLSEDTRSELFLNVLNITNKRLVKEAIELMKTFKIDFWLQTINMINAWPNKVDLVSFVSFIKSIRSDIDCNILSMLTFITDHIREPEISGRATMIYLAMLQIESNDAELMEQLLVQLSGCLQLCLEDENTFVMLLTTYQIINRSILSAWYRNNVNELKVTANVLEEAFCNFQGTTCLFNIVAVLGKLIFISPQFITAIGQHLVTKYYSEMDEAMIQEIRSGNPEDDKHEVIVRKLAILGENKHWNVFSDDQLSLIYDMNMDFLSNQLQHKTMHWFVRLHTNLLKTMCTRLMMGATIPIDQQESGSTTKDLIESLSQLLEDSNVSIEMYHLNLCSYMDLLFLFSPAMAEKYRYPMFVLAQTSCNKSMVRKLAHQVETIVFNYTLAATDETINQQRKILQTWIAFNAHYQELPSLTASERIVRYYNSDSPFKDEIEALMKLLMEKEKNIFAQTVSFAILNLSNRGNLNMFRSFNSSLKSFLKVQFENDTTKLLKETANIACTIATRLKVHIQGSIDSGYTENRMKIFECLKLMMKNMDVTIKQKVIEYMPPDIRDFRLNDIEKKQLDEFIESQSQ